MRTGTTLLGSLTIPGRPQCLRQARQFVARTLGDDSPHTDVAALLASELISNSMIHSHSRDGGTITVNLLAVPDGIRAEIIDEGGTTVPILRPARSGEPDLSENGRGLQLVDTLAARWDYSTDEAGTVTWFELAEPSPG